MPAIKHYVIDQTRQITVCALNEVDALRIADAALDNDEDTANDVVSLEKVWGNTTSSAQVTEVLICQQ